MARRSRLVGATRGGSVGVPFRLEATGGLCVAAISPLQSLYLLEALPRKECGGSFEGAGSAAAALKAQEARRGVWSAVRPGVLSLVEFRRCLCLNARVRQSSVGVTASAVKWRGEAAVVHVRMRQYKRYCET